jgi:hypothetical protein
MRVTRVTRVVLFLWLRKFLQGMAYNLTAPAGVASVDVRTGESARKSA